MVLRRHGAESFKGITSGDLWAEIPLEMALSISDLAIHLGDGVADVPRYQEDVRPVHVEIEECESSSSSSWGSAAASGRCCIAKAVAGLVGYAAEPAELAVRQAG